MLTTVFLLVVLVTMLNVAELEPAAIVTLAGTVASVVLLLVSVIVAPPAGAALSSFTVPVEGDPPTTVVGLSVNEESTAGAAGLTVRAADLLALA